MTADEIRVLDCPTQRIDESDKDYIQRLCAALDAERQRAEELQALLKDYERRFGALVGADTPTLAEG